MYTVKNFRTKKALKQAVKDGEKIAVYQPGPFDDGKPKQGIVYLEGPHYPEPHRWYAKATVVNGIIIKVE